MGNHTNLLPGRVRMESMGDISTRGFITLYCDCESTMFPNDPQTIWEALRAICILYSQKSKDNKTGKGWLFYRLKDLEINTWGIQYFFPEREITTNAGITWGILICASPVKISMLVRQSSRRALFLCPSPWVRWDRMMLMELIQSGEILDTSEYKISRLVASITRISG